MSLAATATSLEDCGSEGYLSSAAPGAIINPPGILFMPLNGSAELANKPLLEEYFHNEINGKGKFTP